MRTSALDIQAEVNAAGEGQLQPRCWVTYSPKGYAILNWTAANLKVIPIGLHFTKTSTKATVITSRVHGSGQFTAPLTFLHRHSYLASMPGISNRVALMLP